MTAMIIIKQKDTERFARWWDWYCDTGKTCLGRGMHCPGASSWSNVHCRSPHGSSSVSVTDSLATWYVRVMASTVTACLPLLPQLQNIILQHSRC